MSPKSPKEWFDQFPRAPGWPASSQWCARHWAPAPVLGANGIGAALEVMQAIVEHMPAKATTARRQGRAMARMGRLCCFLGDERMYEIWGHWPPAKQQDYVV